MVSDRSGGYYEPPAGTGGIVIENKYPDIKQTRQIPSWLGLA